MKVHKASWKIAAYFILFETLYWLNGQKFLLAIKYFLFDGKPLIQTSYEVAAVYHSIYSLLLGLLILGIAIWSFRQFVKITIEEIRK